MKPLVKHEFLLPMPVTKVCIGVNLGANWRVDRCRES
jgi:hypothetical protein